MSSQASDSEGPSGGGSRGRVRPLILFDGVCNLCAASVQWVLARDRKKQFDFASLQSQAATRALAEAGQIGTPATRLDGVVLIDQDGVAVGAEAALGIARRLGFPWSLAAIGRLLPAPARATLYNLIARHRYRWFGKQNACSLPTPELRARFLDADEPRWVEPRTMDAASSDRTSDASAPATDPEPIAERADAVGLPLPIPIPRALARFALRSLLVYLVLAAFPFPLGSVPHTQKLGYVLAAGPEAAATWLGRLLLGREVLPVRNGSGDALHSYLLELAWALAALVAGAVWTLWRRNRAVAPLTLEVVRTYVRFWLAAHLLVYGWVKLMPLQMPPPGPDRWIEAFGDASPMGILWTFMGASPAYEAFAGIGEMLGGLLLLWRRTTLAAALVASVVMLQVVVLNFCYDVPVKLFSLHLLLAALFLLVPHVPRLASVLLLNLPAQPVVLRPFPPRRPWMRRTFTVVHVLFFGLVAIMPVFGTFERLHQQRDGDNPLRRAWRGVYRVESFTRAGLSGSAVSDADRWMRVGIETWGPLAIQRADGSTLRQWMDVNATHQTVKITRRGDPIPIVLAYQAPEPGVLELAGAFEGETIQVRLRRIDDFQPFFLQRGFHWINEFALNR